MEVDCIVQLQLAEGPGFGTHQVMMAMGVSGHKRIQPDFMLHSPHSKELLCCDLRHETRGMHHRHDQQDTDKSLAGTTPMWMRMQRKDIRSGTDDRQWMLD